MLARDTADRFVASGLQPNERIAIFTADDLLLDFTSDPKQIRDALFRLHSSPQAPVKEHSCPDLSDYQAQEILQTNDLDSNAWRAALAESRACGTGSIAGSVDSGASKPDSETMIAIRMLAHRIVDRSQMLARAGLQQLDQVTNLLAQAPGDRSVILVSPGFLSESEQYQLDRMIDRALRAKVVISSLDPKGLAVLTREADASGSSPVLPNPQAVQARHNRDAAKAFAGSDVLAEVAQATGGEFFYDDNDLRAGLTPSDGSFLRLTLQADLKPSYPIAVADILVEYGPVEIGGKTYICPVKSVASPRPMCSPRRLKPTVEAFAASSPKSRTHLIRPCRPCWTTSPSSNITCSARNRVCSPPTPRRRRSNRN
jgi:VWFA-related protein